MKDIIGPHTANVSSHDDESVTTKQFEAVHQRLYELILESTARDDPENRMGKKSPMRGRAYQLSKLMLFSLWHIVPEEKKADAMPDFNTHLSLNRGQLTQRLEAIEDFIDPSISDEDIQQTGEILAFDAYSMRIAHNAARKVKEELSVLLANTAEKNRVNHEGR